MDKESQFTIPPEKLAELMRRHQKELKEGLEKLTPITDVEGLLEKGFAKAKELLNPSRESIQFIEEEGRAFSNKQIEIVKISAFFLEKCAEAANLILRNQREKTFNKEDAEELNILLSELDKKYEDILQKPIEYESALEVISELRENISGFIKKNSNAIYALFDIAKRINAFHHSLLGKEGKSEYSIQASFNFLNKIFNLIISRIPSEALREESALGKLFKSGKGEQAVEKQYRSLGLPIKASAIRSFIEIINEVLSKERLVTMLPGKFHLAHSDGSFEFESVTVADSDKKDRIELRFVGEQINMTIFLEKDGKSFVWYEVKERKNMDKIHKEIQDIEGANWHSFIADAVGEIHLRESPDK